MDETEGIRRLMQAEINSDQRDRQALEAEYGQTWDTQELQRDFIVTGFCAPFVGVVRKADNQKGLLMFRHSPRLYFSFRPTSG